MIKSWKHKGLTAALSAIVERDGKGDIKAVEGANH